MLALRHLGGAAGVEHAGPGAAGGAQQRDRRQLLHRDAVAELEQAGRGGDVEAAVDEGAQVRHARGEREAELLGVRAAGVAHRGGVDGDGGELRVRRRDPHGERDDVGDRGALRVGAVAGADPDRVEPERAEQVGVGDPAVGREREERLGRLDGERAGVERHRREVEQDAVEDGRQVGDRRTALAHRQPDRGDAALEVGEHGLAQRGRVGAHVALPHVPAAGPGRRRARRG